MILKNKRIQILIIFFRYCIILLTESSKKSSTKIFYDILKLDTFNDNVQFAYMYKDIQTEFVDAIAKKYSNLDKTLDNDVEILLLL